MTTARGARLGAAGSLTGAALFWAANYVVGALVIGAIDPFSLAFLRWLFAAIILVGLAQLLERPDWRLVWRRLPRLVLLSSLGMVSFALFLYIGLETTAPISASLVSSTGPVLIAITATIVLRERPGLRQWGGLALALTGVLLVISRGSLDTILGLQFAVGDLWVIVATIAWTAYTVLSRKPLGIPPLTSTAAQAVSATVILGVVVACTGLALPRDGATWGGLAIIVVLSSALAYLFWNLGLAKVPASVAGIFLNLIPVFTVVMELLRGAQVSWAQWLGGALVLGGVLLATLQLRRGR
ncbi:MAG TPA: DMT family transporter [Microbacteriaceae bacterium]|nr:DMT family transporter [Microbacteriaceae bacterium]